MEWSEILKWLIETGTNGAISQFVANNILILGAIVAVTPWVWDNKLLNYFKKGEKK